MNTSENESARPAQVTRIADTEWHAVLDDLVVARGDLSHRADGRTQLSIDAWNDADFDLVAGAMLADLAEDPTGQRVPLHTVVDGADQELRERWQRFGFVAGRRESEYLVPTDPERTGLDPAAVPEGLSILPLGAVPEGPLRALERALGAEIEAGPGWSLMPVERLPWQTAADALDPSRYAVAVREGRWVGLVRVTPGRRARIALVAVLREEQRRGVARALLADALARLREAGHGTAYAEVNEANAAALALFEGIGAERRGSNLELVRR